MFWYLLSDYPLEKLYYSYFTVPSEKHKVDIFLPTLSMCEFEQFLKIYDNLTGDYHLIVLICLFKY